MSDFYATTKENIDREGRSLVGVFPTESDPAGTLPFIYSIGHAQRGLPELLIIGQFDLNILAALANMLGDLMFETNMPLAESVNIGGQFNVKARMASDLANKEYTIQALGYAQAHYPEKPVDIQQVILCDPKGIYQGDPAIDPQYDAPLV